MKITTISGFVLPINKYVKVTYMGNITELLYLQHKNWKCPIKMIGNNQYIKTNEDTEEVYNCKQKENRSQSYNSIKRTMRNLRNVINTNVSDTTFCRWVTLTYAENMTDDKKIRLDFNEFNRRTRKLYGQYEYIAVREPQGRGAWHLHIIMIFPKKAPYMKNSKVAECWGKGFVYIKKLDDVDNVGSYLTAYLTDMPVEQCKENNIDYNGLETKTVDFPGKNGKLSKKKFIKGARLSLYPPKMNLYTCSKGIKEPQFEYLKEIDAEKKISSAKLTFSNAIQMIDEKNQFENIIYKRYYNTKK